MEGAVIGFTIIGVLAIIAFVAAYRYRQRQKQKNLATCTALYPGNSIAILQKRDSCFTQKEIARRTAYG